MITSIEQLKKSDKRVLFVVEEERGYRAEGLAAVGCRNNGKSNTFVRKVFSSLSGLVEGEIRRLVSERRCQGYDSPNPKESTYLEREEEEGVTTFVRINYQKVDVEPKELIQVGPRICYKGLPIED